MDTKAEVTLHSISFTSQGRFGRAAAVTFQIEHPYVGDEGCLVSIEVGSPAVDDAELVRTARNAFHHLSKDLVAATAAWDVPAD